MEWKRDRRIKIMKVSGRVIRLWQCYTSPKLLSNKAEHVADIGDAERVYAAGLPRTTKNTITYSSVCASHLEIHTIALHKARLYQELVREGENGERERERENGERERETTEKERERERERLSPIILIKAHCFCSL